MKSRAISLILLLGLFTGIFASCSKGSTDEKNLNLSVNFDGMVFKADTINTAIKGNEIAVYTRDYRDNTGSYQLRIGGSHTDRAVVSVKYSNTVEFGIEYTVISVDTTTNNKSNTPIPVNGFVISLPLEKVSGLKIKKDKEIEVFGFEQIASEYERFDLCTFIPEDKTLTRRVYYVNPVDGINENSNITLLTSKYSVDTELPPGSVAFILRLVATANYRISSIQEGGTIAKGTNALVFIGEYNTMYAKSLFKENVKMYISREERASSYSDISAVVIGEEVYKIGEERTNLESITESGLYFYNSYHTELVTPAREIDFYDVVVVDDIVVYKGAKNTRILIPSNNGVVVAFTGEKAVLAESLSIGDKITTIIVKTRNLPEKYISVNKYIFELNSTNASRSTNNPCVLYTPEYGEATGTDNDGTEIIISDNKVTSVLYARGDTKIPENGYVLSIHNSSTSYKHADKIETGMKCLISLSNSVYSITELDYDGINTVRTSDSLIVYKGVQSTGTNAYGYEVLVSGDGLIIGESTSGNSKIPGGGLVLSGHGKSAKLLSNLYVNGANIILNEVDRSVKIIKSPTLNIQNALNAYENAVKLFEEAKKQFYDIDYTEVQNTLNEISELTEQIGIAINSTDYPEAIRLSEIVKESIDTLGYSMIRSSAVENRAAWYRSYDKSDSEVRAAIEKAAALNINAIYLETWYNGMVIGYSDNKLISHNKTAHGDFDALESFCRIGHEYGIEIHAWVENFFIGTLSYAEANPDSLVSNTVGKHLLDSQGNNYNKTIFGDYVFLNPYDKENRSLVLNIYKEIIENYDIDGIHLDYIRFPEYNFGTFDYGYNTDIVEGFRKEYDTTVDPGTLKAGTEMFDNWCRFRENIINSWVEEVYELVISTKPDLWISSACYPDALTVPKTLYQNFTNWIENGWMDEIFSMSYSTDNKVVRDNAELFESLIKDKAFYSTGISAFGETTKSDFASQLDIIRGVGADGSAVFSLGSITADNYQEVMIKSSYSKKSVQTYLLNKTISAGMNDMLRKLDTVYGFERDYKFSDKIKPIINDMLKKADKFDSEKATVRQKLQYTETAISDLERIITAINTVSVSEDEKEMKDALIKDFERYKEYMTQSQYRLRARLTENK